MVNDADMRSGTRYGVQSWPTIVLIDPEGNTVGRNAGEVKAEDVDAGDRPSHRLLPQEEADRQEPAQVRPGATEAEPTPLRFPGKVLADEEGKRLFIADSNHNRIVITRSTASCRTPSAPARRQDGRRLRHGHVQPSAGMAVNGDTLYVADTRTTAPQVDLKAKKVTTVAGTGEQGAGPRTAAGRTGKPEADSSSTARGICGSTATTCTSPWPGRTRSGR